MLLSGSTAEIKQPEHRYFGGHGGQGRDKTNIVMAWVYGQAPIDLASNLFALASNLLLTCTETLALPSTLLASRPGNGSTVHLCLHCTVLLQMKSGCSLKNGLENEFWTSMRVCRPRKIWWEKSCRRREGISGAWRRKKNKGRHLDVLGLEYLEILQPAENLQRVNESEHRSRFGVDQERTGVSLAEQLGN